MKKIAHGIYEALIDVFLPMPVEMFEDNRREETELYNTGRLSPYSPIVTNMIVGFLS